MARLTVASHIPKEEQIAFVVDCLRKLFSYEKTIRLIKQKFDIRYAPAVELYAETITSLYKQTLQPVKPTYDSFLEAMLDLKGRCEEAGDLNNEVRVMRDLGKILGFIKTDTPEAAITVDEERERKAEERFAELMAKYKRTDST